MGVATTRDIRCSLAQAPTAAEALNRLGEMVKEMAKVQTDLWSAAAGASSVNPVSGRRGGGRGRNERTPAAGVSRSSWGNCGVATKPGVRRVMCRRSVILAAVACALLGTLFAVPWVLLSRARSALDAEPCAFGRQEGTPPTEAFFHALDTLAVVSYFPGFGSRADDLAAAASSRCVANFTIACEYLRYDAQRRGHEDLWVRRKAAFARVVTDEERLKVTETAIAEGDTFDWRAHVHDEERRAHCTKWQRWADWLAEAKVDIDGLCPVCAPRL